MTSSTVYLDLKRALPEDAWPTVIAALRQDPLVWEELQLTTFRGAAVQRLGNSAQAWSPVNLGFLALGSELRAEALRNEQTLLPEELRERAAQTARQIIDGEAVQPCLAKATLLALALWKGSADQASLPASPLTDCALACLFGLLPQPEELLINLPVERALHALLSNPLDTETLLAHLLKRLQSVADEERLALLAALQEQRPQLAARLAGKAAALTPAQNASHASAPPRSKGVTAALRLPLADLQSLLQQADLEDASGDIADMQAALDKARRTADQLQTALAIELAQAAARGGNPGRALELWREHQANLKPKHSARIALALIANGFTAEALELASTLEGIASEDIAVLLTQAFLAQQRGNRREARLAAQAALARRASSTTSALEDDQIADILLRIALVDEAITVAEDFARQHPNHPGIARLLAEAYLRASQAEKALPWAHLSAALTPEDHAARTRLAEALEGAQNYEEALQERLKLIQHPETATPEDRRAAARTALRASRADIATAICRQLLSEAPQDGIALTLLGQALLATGEVDEGRDALEQAVQFAPNHPEPWLALAEHHKQAGDPKRSLETLLQATRAGVESPRLLLALGKAQLENQSPTQALESLRRAVSHLSSSQEADDTLAAECHRVLGQLLLDLGHNQEAAEVLAEACRVAPAHADLHHARALALWRLDRHEEAFSAFERARELDPEDDAILLDHGRALLEEDIHDPRGEQTLHQLLEINPQQNEAVALLARYYEHNDQPHTALEAYQHALGSELSNDPHWKKTLTLGLGRTALRLKQPEAALAALESLNGAGDDPATARLLAEAYRANRLHEKALQVAQQAVERQPGDRETTLWFCDLAAEVGELQIALTALNAALEEHPQATDLLLRRAELLRQLEQPQAAAKDFDRVATLETATPEDLIHAAEGLLAVEDPARAAIAFERAAALYKSTPHAKEGAPGAETPLGRTLARLAETYTRLGEPQNALRTLEEAIQHAPQNTSLLAAKAAALLDLGQDEQAAHWLEAQLKAFPTDPALNYQAALIQHARGALAIAFERAQSALHAYATRKALHDEQRARLLAAQLAYEILRPVAGRSLLAETRLQEAQPAANLTEALLQCLRGELALEAGEEVEAAQALTAALVQQPAHPRTLALQARLRLRHGDGQAANDNLKQAFAAYGELEAPSPQDTLALAEAALECQAFSAAVHLLSKAADPASPRLHLMYARALTLRAEHQQLCRAVNIHRHAPGAAALAEEAYRQFEEAILAANRALEKLGESLGEERAAAQTAVSTWLARGQAAFRPSRQHAQALLDLPYSPANQAAYLAALRLSGEGKAAAQQAAALLEAENASPPEHPYLLAQVALALAREAPEAAARAAQHALDHALKQGWPQYPVFIALKGSIAHRNAARAVQLQAAQDLLTIWEEEPYWHLMAADLLLEQTGPDPAPQTNQAVKHLEKAIQIDPLNKASYRKLGRAYLKAGNAEAAVEVLQRALAVDRDDPAIWLALAQAQLHRGDLAEAAKSAHTAARLGEDPAEAYLLLAQIAMQSGAPGEAQRYASQVLRLNRGHPQALMVLAEALQALEKPADALAALEAAAARSLPDTPLLLKIVELRRAVQGEKAAAKELERLYEHRPADPRIGLALAEALGNLGQTSRAIHVAQKTLHNTGDLTEEEQARLHFVLGRMLRQSGQLDQAIQALSDAADIQPEWVEPYLELGRVYHERRQYQRAIQILQQAISIAPGDARAYHWAGLALKEIKDYPNAEVMLRKAARLAPNDIRIHRQLGAVVALNLVHNKQNALVDSH